MSKIQNLILDVFHVFISIVHLNVISICTFSFEDNANSDGNQVDRLLIKIQQNSPSHFKNTLKNKKIIKVDELKQK